MSGWAGGGGGSTRGTSGDGPVRRLDWKLAVAVRSGAVGAVPACQRVRMGTVYCITFTRQWWPSHGVSAVGPD